MKKILFPTDFSETSDNAFVHALELAKTLHAELVLLHTFDLPIVDSQVFPEYYLDIFNSLELSKFEHFKDKIPALRKIAAERNLEHITMTHLLMDGDLLYNIKKAVKKENIDFVVMGTKGASGWYEIFIGTNTSSVIAEVSIPILCVPLEAKFEKIETIAFTTRFRKKDIDALEKVLVIAKKLKAKVKCLYVKTASSDVTSETIKRWESHFEEEPIQIFVIPDDNVKQTIKDFLDNQSIDVLAMLTYKRNFFEEFFKPSLTQKLSYQLEIPILALHD